MTQDVDFDFKMLNPKNTVIILKATRTYYLTSIISVKTSCTDFMP